MGTVPGERLTAQLASDESAGLTMPRLVLAVHLRRLREQRQLDGDAAARVVGSETTLAGMEAGLIGSRLDDVIALCDLYRVDGHATRVALLELARQSHQGGWWQSFRPVIPLWFLPYLGAEHAAEVIRCYTGQYVPDLLQTPDYARAQIQLVPRLMPVDEIEQRVALRRRRQHVLHRPRPALLWAVIDEGALRRPV